MITSGYRSPEVNRAVGGSPSSNHLSGCAVDIRCAGFEQAVRYASILLDIADDTGQDYDELFIERKKAVRYWLHFAVRPEGNRRKNGFLLYPFHGAVISRGRRNHIFLSIIKKGSSRLPFLNRLFPDYFPSVLYHHTMGGVTGMDAVECVGASITNGDDAGGR